MKIEHFEELLKGNNGIKISDDLVVYNDCELYNYRTEESKYYNNVKEMVEDNPEVKKIIEEAEAFYLDWSGGNGASSSSGTMGGGFKSAPGKPAESKNLLPAELNLGTAGGNSVEKVLGRFQNKYGKANREYAIAVDKDGYVKQHIKGGKHSVGITGDAGDTIIHNHPSGSNFSGADMHSFANTKIKSLVATSSNGTTKGTYTITKTNKFKAKEFDKAIDKAKWNTDKYGYNDGVNWWLKKNQKTYGYTYTAKGVKNAAKGQNGW